jgi:hypothetical protein
MKKYISIMMFFTQGHFTFAQQQYKGTYTVTSGRLLPLHVLTGRQLFLMPGSKC